MTVPGFDYAARAAERFEVPIAERIAAIRARKAEERARSREKATRSTSAPVTNRGWQKSREVAARPVEARPADARATEVRTGDPVVRFVSIGGGGAALSWPSGGGRRRFGGRR